MAMKVESISKVLEKSFMPVNKTELKPQSVFAASNERPEFGCDDIPLLMKDLHDFDPEAAKTVEQYVIRRLNSRVPPKPGAQLTVEALRTIMVIAGGIHEGAYRYEVEGFWKKKQAIGW